MPRLSGEIFGSLVYFEFITISVSKVCGYGVPCKECYIYTVITIMLHVSFDLQCNITCNVTVQHRDYVSERNVTCNITFIT